MRDSGDDDGTTVPPVIVAETTAAILAAGTVIDGWSRLVALLAGMLILLSLATEQPTLPVACGVLSLIGALAQLYCAARITIDARLFSSWARRWHTQASDPKLSDRIAADLAHFDGLIAGLRNACDEHRTQQPRGLRARQRGALELLRRQSVCLVLQLLAFVGSLASAFCLWHPFGMIH